jgi:hypothetical protein
MVTIYRDIDVVSTFVSEHRKSDFDRARKSKLTAKDDVKLWLVCGVRVESKTPLASKWSPNLSRISLVFS